MASRSLFFKLTYGSIYEIKGSIIILYDIITTINDNGEHPNFILKSRYPDYDKEVYPKFFKVSTQEELNTILGNVTSDYFLMENYCNTTNNFEEHIKVIRSLNILYPPTLESIQIGQYTKFNENITFSDVEYDSVTYMVNPEYRDSYVTALTTKGLPKLLDTAGTKTFSDIFCQVPFELKL